MAESWRKAWRDGFVPSLPVAGLEALARALRADDPRLLQGATTSPPVVQAVQDWPVEAADPVGFCFWMDPEAPLLSRVEGREPPVSVAHVEESFARACFDCDERLGEPAACRWFLNWWDETPREEAARLLLAEVEENLLLLRVEGAA